MRSQPSKTVHNERVKLRATALNALAIASAVAGFVTPVVALSFGVATSTARDYVGTSVVALVWLVVGLLVHYLAWLMLGGLQE